ncbi:DMT family transporter [Rhizobium sp. NFR03]|uniref:DMT family transporter n=1 Tax=Rhizobium sp. NFR03 TaxID=1566263 RepID=UPI00244E9DE0|nr:DMT family transporter [Rhizobium sp. NFR03]
MKPLLCLLSTGALLGMTTVIAGLAIRAGWHPVAFLFWSALGGGLLLAIIAFMSGERPKASLALFRYALLSGLLSFALPNMLSFVAIPHVGAGFVALCLAFPPLLTYGLALPLGLDRFSAGAVVGMAFGFGGAVLLAASKPAAGGDGWMWTGVVLLVPFIIATGNIYRTVAWPEQASPRLLAPAMVLTAAMIIGLYATLAHVPFTPAIWDRSVMVLLMMQMAIIAGTYALYFVLQKLNGPVGLGQIGWIGAATGKLLAVACLGEVIHAILPPAFLLILVGIVLVSRRGK